MWLAGLSGWLYLLLLSSKTGVSSGSSNFAKNVASAEQEDHSQRARLMRGKSQKHLQVAKSHRKLGMQSAHTGESRLAVDSGGRASFLQQDEWSEVSWPEEDTNGGVVASGGLQAAGHQKSKLADWDAGLASEPFDHQAWAAAARKPTAHKPAAHKPARPRQREQPARSKKVTTKEIADDEGSANLAELQYELDEESSSGVDISGNEVKNEIIGYNVGETAWPKSDVPSTPSGVVVVNLGHAEKSVESVDGIKSVKQVKGYNTKFGPSEKICEDGRIWSGPVTNENRCTAMCDADPKCAFISSWSDADQFWCQLSASCAQQDTKAGQSVTVSEKGTPVGVTRAFSSAASVVGEKDKHVVEWANLAVSGTQFAGWYRSGASLNFYTTEESVTVRITTMKSSQASSLVVPKKTVGSWTAQFDDDIFKVESSGKVALSIAGRDDYVQVPPIDKVLFGMCHGKCRIVAHEEGATYLREFCHDGTDKTYGPGEMESGSYWVVGNGTRACEWKSDVRIAGFSYADPPHKDSTAFLPTKFFQKVTPMPVTLASAAVISDKAADCTVNDVAFQIPNDNGRIVVEIVLKEVPAASVLKCNVPVMVLGEHSTLIDRVQVLSMPLAPWTDPGEKKVQYCGFITSSPGLKTHLGCGLEGADGDACSTTTCPDLASCQTKCNACTGCVGVDFRLAGINGIRCYMLERVQYTRAAYRTTGGDGAVWDTNVNSREAACALFSQRVSTQAAKGTGAENSVGQCQVPTKKAGIVLCTDGTEVDDYSCHKNGFGNRAKCPPDVPVMCNSQTCGKDGLDWCCQATCEALGGARKCNESAAAGLDSSQVADDMATTPAITPGTPQPVEDNLIQNGGFSQGLNNWAPLCPDQLLNTHADIVGECKNSGVWTKVPKELGGDTRAYHIKEKCYEGNVGGFYQDFPTIKGKTYTVKFKAVDGWFNYKKVKQDTGTSYVEIQSPEKYAVMDKKVTVKSSAKEPFRGQWEQKGPFTFMAAGSTSRIFFYSGNTSCTTIDDVWVVEAEAAPYTVYTLEGAVQRNAVKIGEDSAADQGDAVGAASLASNDDGNTRSDVRRRKSNTGSGGTAPGEAAHIKLMGRTHSNTMNLSSIVKPGAKEASVVVDAYSLSSGGCGYVSGTARLVARRGKSNIAPPRNFKLHIMVPMGVEAAVLKLQKEHSVFSVKGDDSPGMLEFRVTADSRIDVDYDVEVKTFLFCKELDRKQWKLEQQKLQGANDLCLTVAEGTDYGCRQYGCNSNPTSDATLVPCDQKDWAQNYFLDSSLLRSSSPADRCLAIGTAERACKPVTLKRDAGDQTQLWTAQKSATEDSVTWTTQTGFALVRSTGSSANPSEGDTSEAVDPFVEACPQDDVLQANSCWIRDDTGLDAMATAKVSSAVKSKEQDGIKVKVLYSEVWAEAICPWRFTPPFHTGSSKIKCYDNTLCDPSTDGRLCCAERLGTFMCSADAPFMCREPQAEGKGAADYPCVKDDVDCADKGGRRGCEGPPGRRGNAGLKGAPGATGEEGPVGDEGPVGPEGLQGPTGPTGAATHTEVWWLYGGIKPAELWIIFFVNIAITAAAGAFLEMKVRKLDKTQTGSPPPDVASKSGAQPLKVLNVKSAGGGVGAFDVASPPGSAPRSSPAGSPAGSVPAGSPAGSVPRSSPAGSPVGSPAGSIPAGSPAGSIPAGSPAGSFPPSPAGSIPAASPAGSFPPSPAGSIPAASPAASPPLSPAGSIPAASPAASVPGSPVGSPPGSPVASVPASPAGSPPGSPIPSPR